MRFLSLPIKPILLCSLLSISVIPTFIVTLQLYSIASDDAERELEEKHLSLAKNLTAPVYAYLENHRTIVQSISRRLGTENVKENAVASYLFNAKFDFKNIQQLVYFHIPNQKFTLSEQNPSSVLSTIQMQSVACIQPVINSQSGAFTSIVKNPFSQGNTVMFCEPVFNKNKLKGIVIAALHLDMIEEYRAGVAFGDSGHSAIVDQAGVVVAHPNLDWTIANKDISDWPIVKAMINGESGITQFYSSFTKKDMFAAYTTVPEFGWGIMVPQFKSEIDDQIFAAYWPQIQWGGFSILLAIILSVYLSKWIANPLTQLVKGTFMLSEKRLNGGALKLNTGSPKELQQLSNALEMLTRQFIQIKSKLESVNNSLKDRVDDATEQLREQNKRFEKMAVYDELTELPNRRGLKQMLEESLANAKTDNKVFSILLCDLDRFKLVNDSYGHRVGDNVLQAFANIAPTALSDQDYIGRWGGEEFMCVLVDSNSDKAKIVAENIRNVLQDVAVLPDAIGLELTVSIGVATYPYDSESADELITCADNALYEAKHVGRNAVVCASGIKQSVSYVAKQIRCALTEDGLKTAFQSIYDISTQKVVGQQSLARISCGKDEIIEASHFIHQAEELDMVVNIDEFVMKQTLQFIDNNYSDSQGNLAFIHLSKDYLLSLSAENKIFKRIKQIKAKHQYENDFPLVLELSESQFINREKDLKQIIKMLLEQGIKIALRKFETSATGLELLTSLPFDYVKLDGSSIRLAMGNERYETALKHLITMCKDLDLIIIVEQIETTHELEFCRSLNIDLAQGYCLARPKIPIEQDLVSEI